MATHPSILAWEIPWTEEAGRLQSMGCKELDMIERLNMGMRATEHEHGYVCIHMYIVSIYSICIIYVYRILYRCYT